MKPVCLFLILALGMTLNAQTYRPPSPDTLSAEDRIIGLTRIWHEIKNDFAFYDKIGFDWDSAYTATLRLALHTRGRLEYYQLLRKLVASVRDGHTNLYLPADLRAEHLAFPPLRLKKIENRIFIEALLNDSLQSAGLAPKDELLQINGIDVLTYGKQFIMPYVSASTQQDLLNRTYTNELLTGARTSPLTLTVKKPGGATHTVTISRSLSPQRRPFPSCTFNLLPDGIGLLSINSFDDTALSRLLPLAMRSAQSCKALVIDLRRNGGGNGAFAYDLLDHLFEGHYTDTWPHSRMRISAWQAFHYPGADNWLHYPIDSLRYAVPAKPVKFLKPLALLISEKTFSAAEDFAATLKQNKRALLIGSPSGGSTGLNVYHNLPGGGNFRLTIKKDTYTDGTEFVGVGILPDIPVTETVDDFMQNHDRTLQTAVDLLRKQLARE